MSDDPLEELRLGAIKRAEEAFKDGDVDQVHVLGFFAGTRFPGSQEAVEALRRLGGDEDDPKRRE